jgi:NADH-quinone oxidoreductase subunit M
MQYFPWLSFLIWWPVLGAVIIIIADKLVPASMIKGLSALVCAIELAACIPLYLAFDANSYHMQFVELHAWIASYGINYALGIDGISLALIMLTAFTTLVVVLAGFKLITKHVAQYMAAFLISQGLMIGVFAATDAILFYMFWEAMLIPIYLSIGIWGGENRSYAAIKFFIYTFLGSVLMLVALIYLHFQTHSFEIAKFYALELPLNVQLWLFIAFFLAFAVKVPMWPFHTWLPDAHTAAPAGGSVVLAALMLKVGVYGFLRFSMPIAPMANQLLDGWVIALALVAIVYIGILAIMQKDMKKLIAYSSIAHMGFAVLGCYMVYNIMKVTGSHSEAYLSFEGAVVQMISHAFSTGGMFLAVGILQYKVGSRLIKDFGGVAKTMPVFAAFFMLFSLANVGLPGTSGFVGEFMIIIAAMHANFWVALLAGSTLVIAAGYTLWMYKRVFFGEVISEKVAALGDIGKFEIFIFGMLAAAVLFIGFYPQWLLEILHSSVGHLLTESLQFKF